MLTLGVKGFYPKTAYAYKSRTCAKQIITSKNKMSTIKLAKYDFLLCISGSLKGCHETKNLWEEGGRCRDHREEKWWHHKNKTWEIKGLISTSRQNKMKNAPWLKISLLVEIGTVMLRWLHLNPSKMTWIVNIMIQANFRKICMDQSSEHSGAYISSPICTNSLGRVVQSWVKITQG